jgi:O-antigen/teichoic acid export membrane protein
MNKDINLSFQATYNDGANIARRLWRVSLYSNAFYLLAGNGIGAAMGFIFWTVAARFYSTSDVGTISAAIAAMGLLGSLSNLGLGVGVVRFLPRDDKQAAPLINFSLTIVLMVSAISAIIFLLGAEFWSPGLTAFRQEPGRFILFILFTVFTAIVTVADGIFVARRRAGFTMARGLSMNVIKVILVIAFIGASQSYGIFTAWGSALSISLLLGLFFFLPRVIHDFLPSPDFNWKGKSEIIRYSLVNNGAALLSGLPGQILPIMLLGMLGAEANAFFYIAWQIMAAISMIPQSLSTSLFAEGCHDEKELSYNIWRSLGLALAILVPVIIVLLLFSSPLLRVFGVEYAGHSTRLLQVLALSIVPMTVNQLYFSILRVQKRLKILTVLNGVIALVTLAITYPLLPVMDTLGAGIGWMASQSLVAVWIIFGQGRLRIILRTLASKWYVNVNPAG